MANKIQIRRGVAASRPTLDQGEPALDTDAVRAWVGTAEGNRELQLKGSTTDYTIYVASSTYGGVPSSSGATGKPLLTGTADAGTGGTTLYDAAGTFTSAAHLNKAIYNATQDKWSKIASVSSSTNLTLSVSGSFAAGDTYVITNAFDNIPEAFNVADTGYNANITIRASDGAFPSVLTLIGKTAGAAKTLTLQGSTTGTTTVSGETSIYQKISLKNITFTKRIFEYFGADVDWTTCVTSGDDGFLLLKSTSVANVFRTSSVIIFENDPAVYTSISSTVTKGYTLYVATSTYGGDDAVGDGLKITQGTATSTTANKLVDSTANFNSTDHLNKTLYNSTDDTWAKITAIDSTTQLSISADIMASGEAYVIANAVATVQKAIDLIPGSVNCNTTVRASNGTYTLSSPINIWGKIYSGSYSISCYGTKNILSSGTATAGANGAGNGSAGFGTLTDTTKAWTVNAYQNKFIEITSGTGSGQIRAIQSNTATVATVVGRWTTTPDATSVYRIYDCGSIIDGNATAAICIYIANGQKTINLYDLAITNPIYHGIWVNHGSIGNVRRCQFTVCPSRGVLLSGASVGLIQTSTFVGGSTSIRAEGGSIIDPCNYNRCTVATYASINASFGGKIANLDNTYVGASWTGILLDGPSAIFAGAYLEVDGSSSHNISCVANSYFLCNTSPVSTMVSKNSGAWGALMATGGFGGGVSGMTYSGNVSGTYSPTTATLGGNT